MGASASGYIPQTEKLPITCQGDLSIIVLSPERQQALKELDTLAAWFDDKFRLPGTHLHFGLDSILGLVPGVGDTVTAGVSAYLVARARQLGARKRVVAIMLKNVAVDWLVGTIPLVGDIFDFAHKANRKNINLLREDLLRQWRISQVHK